MRRRFAGAGLGRRSARSSAVGSSALPTMAPSEFGARLYYHLDPAVGVTLTSGKVSQWVPAGGSEAANVALAQGTDAARPVMTTLDGLPVMQFGGSAQRLADVSGNDNLGGANGDVTFVFMSKIDSLPASNESIFVYRTATPNTRMSMSCGSTPFAACVNFMPDHNAGSQTINGGVYDTRWHITAYRHTATRNEIWVDKAKYFNLGGAQKRTASSHVFGANMHLCSFVSSSANNPAITYGDIIMLSGTVTDAECDMLFNWLRAKYASLSTTSQYSWNMYAGQSNVVNSAITGFSTSGDSEYIQFPWIGETATSLAVDWAPGAENDLEFMAALARLPRANGVTKTAVTIVQGESDAGDETNANNYQANLTAWISRIRSAAGDSSMPIIVVELGDTCTATYQSTVKAAQIAVAGALSNVYTVDTDDMPRGDGLHFDDYAELHTRILAARAIAWA